MDANHDEVGDNLSLTENQTGLSTGVLPGQLENRNHVHLSVKPPSKYVGEVVETFPSDTKEICGNSNKLEGEEQDCGQVRSPHRSIETDNTGIEADKAQSICDTNNEHKSEVVSDKSGYSVTFSPKNTENRSRRGIFSTGDKHDFGDPFTRTDGKIVEGSSGMESVSQGKRKTGSILKRTQSSGETPVDVEVKYASTVVNNEFHNSRQHSSFKKMDKNTRIKGQKSSLPQSDSQHQLLANVSSVDSEQSFSSSSEASPEDTSRESNENDAAGTGRRLWGSRMEYLLSSVGYVTGLPNVWSFPVLCVMNGGGSFLLPYFIFLMMAGLPLVFLEVALSQYTSKGAISVWKVVPGLKGLGYGMVLASTVVGVYNSVPISWLFRFLLAILQNQLLWESCNNEWNTQACCSTQVYVHNCSLLNSSLPQNITCMACVSNLTMDSYNLTREGATMRSFQNDSQLSPVMFNLPSEEYFKHHVLLLSGGITEFGIMQWDLVLCTFISFVLVFLYLIRGIQSSGKVAYLTVIVPYIVLIVLLVRWAILPGSARGVTAFLHPDWEKLKDNKVWFEAASHVFSSLGVAYGGHVTLASYCPFSNPSYRSAWMVCVIKSLTSVLCGFAISSVAGHAAYLLNLPITQILSAGPSLVFELVPWACSRLPNAPVWLGLFFLMLALMTLNNQVVHVLTVVTALVDEFPVVFHGKWVLVTAVVCMVMFLLSFPFSTQAGLYLYTLLSRFSTSWCVLAFALLECVAIGWVYGYDQFSQNVWNMGAKRPGRWWRLVWQYLTPAGLLFVLVNGILLFHPLHVAGVALPIEAIVFGVALASLIALCVPVVAIYTYASKPGSPQERWPLMWKPAKDWITDQPADEDIPDYIQSDPEVLPIARKGIFSLTAENLAKMDLLSPTAKPVQGSQPGDDIDTGSIAWSEDENKDRGNWSGRYDFLMSGLGYTVGLGNVWRFPYLVYKNGGGAFFLPYIVMLIFCGMPLFYMELAFGQFASSGPISIWRVSPFFKGLGYSACLMVFLVTVYYNLFNAWSVMYFFASMTRELPWTHCNNSWNTPTCRVRGRYSVSVQNCTDADISDNVTRDNVSNCTWMNVTVPNNFSSSPMQEFFDNYVLGQSSGIDDVGELRWHLCLSLLFCWIITFAAVARGIKSVGKVVYITVSFPYVILLVLLARYVTLGEGHLEGIRFYVSPDWSMLGSAQVWGDAASQLFFSLGVTMGGLTALSSYNRFHYDCFRDAYMICLIDTLTSVFAGFVIFAILGVMAKEAGLEIENVVTSKFLLAYIVYPEAVTRLPVAPLWSLLFFLMMFLLAVDSQFLMVEGIVTALLDEFPEVLGKRRVWLILALCVFSYLLGLPLCTQGGLYIVELVDRYATLWGPLVNGILMCMALGWVYGTENFSCNIKAMLGKEVGIWWKLMWKFITPLILLFILVFSWVMYEAPSKDNYLYPTWAHILGLSLSAIPVLCIPVVAVVQLFKAKGSCRKKWQRLVRPDGGWGPALRKHQLLVKYMPGQRRASSFSLFSSTSTDGGVFTTNESASFPSGERSTMENPKIVISSPLKDHRKASPSGSQTPSTYGSLTRNSLQGSHSSLGIQSTRRRHNSSGKRNRTISTASLLSQGTSGSTILLPDKSKMVKKPIQVADHISMQDKATQTYRQTRIRAITHEMPGTSLVIEKVFGNSDETNAPPAAYSLWDENVNHNSDISVQQETCNPPEIKTEEDNNHAQSKNDLVDSIDSYSYKVDSSSNSTHKQIGDYEAVTTEQ